MKTTLNKWIIVLCSMVILTSCENSRSDDVEEAADLGCRYAEAMYNNLGTRKSEETQEKMASITKEMKDFEKKLIDKYGKEKADQIAKESGKALEKCMGDLMK